DGLGHGLAAREARSSRGRARAVRARTRPRRFPRASRMFRVSHPERERAQMAEAATRQWRELEAEAGGSILEPTDEVHHGDPAHLRAAADSLTATGTAFELLRPEEATERWTGFRFAGVVLCRSDAGRAGSEIALEALYDQAVAHGAEFRFAEPVQSLE